MKYVRIRSWHVILTNGTINKVLPGTYRTRCGRTVQTRELWGSFPLDEKSCETCLRLTRSTDG